MSGIAASAHYFHRAARREASGNLRELKDLMRMLGIEEFVSV